ncbi:hypothetical protein L9F63_015023, partial [Diploptera punctata]
EIVPDGSMASEDLHCSSSTAHQGSRYLIPLGIRLLLCCLSASGETEEGMKNEQLYKAPMLYILVYVCNNYDKHRICLYNYMHSVIPKRYMFVQLYDTVLPNKVQNLKIEPKNVLFTENMIPNMIWTSLHADVVKRLQLSFR